MSWVNGRPGTLIAMGSEPHWVQDGFQAQGQLTDFSSRAFMIKASPFGASSFPLV